MSSKYLISMVEFVLCLKHFFYARVQIADLAIKVIYLFFFEKSLQFRKIKKNIFEWN